MRIASGNGCPRCAGADAPRGGCTEALVCGRVSDRRHFAHRTRGRAARLVLGFVFGWRGAARCIFERLVGVARRGCWGYLWAAASRLRLCLRSVGASELQRGFQSAQSAPDLRSGVRVMLICGATSAILLCVVTRIESALLGAILILAIGRSLLSGPRAGSGARARNHVGSAGVRRVCCASRSACDRRRPCGRGFGWCKVALRWCCILRARARSRWRMHLMRRELLLLSA